MKGSALLILLLLCVQCVLECNADSPPPPKTSPPPPHDPPPPPPNDNGVNKTWIIVGCSILFGAVVIIAISVTICCLRMKKTQSEKVAKFLSEATPLATNDVCPPSGEWVGQVRDKSTGKSRRVLYNFNFGPAAFTGSANGIGDNKDSIRLMQCMCSKGYQRIAWSEKSSQRSQMLFVKVESFVLDGNIWVLDGKYDSYSEKVCGSVRIVHSSARDYVDKYLATDPRGQPTAPSILPSMYPQPTAPPIMAPATLYNNAVDTGIELSMMTPQKPHAQEDQGLIGSM